MSAAQSIRRALISTSDKTGLIELAQQLNQQKIEIIATSGSARLLREHGIKITEVVDFTKFPEIMGGRVKTLHPKIHGGLLGRRGIDDKAMEQHGISPIDLLVVNLYPFSEVTNQPDCSLENAIEHIDVGGPSMLRAAAKNFFYTTTLVDPNDYDTVLTEMANNNGKTRLATRRKLAIKVFNMLSSYDHNIANYLNTSENDQSSDLFPSKFKPVFRKRTNLRYGENPHQQAALYEWQENNNLSNSLLNAKQLQGKPLSYNNMLDSECALQCVQALSQNNAAACVIVKHATPCGAATADDPQTAYEKAYTTDPESAFGGIIALNMPLNDSTAKKIVDQQFAEVIIAPKVHQNALAIFSHKPNLRVLEYKQSDHTKTKPIIQTITDGILLQEADTLMLNINQLQVVSKRKPDASLMKDLYFAWVICKYVKSNAIVYAKNGAALGIGGGQTSRVFAAKIAVLKAEEAKLSVKGAVMGSDAFFPFADSIEFAAQHGIDAVIQPGGSKRDSEVIAAADKANMVMIFTGNRHFRH